MPSAPTSIDLSPIRAIAFDAVGTLIYATPPVSSVYASAARKYGSALSDVEVSQRLRGAFQRSRNVDGDPHTTSEAAEWEFWRVIVAEALDDVVVPAACFDELFAWFGQSSAWRCYSDVADVIRACRDTDRALAVASNFDNRLHSVLDGLPPLAEIKCRVISSRVGFRKPSAKFYDALCRELNCQPSEVLMVGDDWLADAVGARSAGLSVVQVDRSVPVTESAVPDPSIPVIRNLRELIPLLSERVFRRT